MRLIELESLTSILGVLTALIAPAVLLSASGTFITSTASRVATSTQRVRLLAAQLRNDEGRDEARRARLQRQMEFTYRRVVVQQRALRLFYSAATCFVACSLALGLESLVPFPPNWLPVVLGVLGVVLLQLACALLMGEARRMVAGLREEMAEVQAEARPPSPAPRRPR